MTDSVHGRQAILRIGSDRELFDGHFPGHPILPGAKLLDLVIAHLRDSGDLPAGAIDVASAKFLATVAPASALTLSWTRSAEGLCRFECHSGPKKVAMGALRATAAADLGAPG